VSNTSSADATRKWRLRQDHSPPPRPLRPPCSNSNDHPPQRPHRGCGVGGTPLHPHASFGARGRAAGAGSGVCAARGRATAADDGAQGGRVGAGSARFFLGGSRQRGTEPLRSCGRGRGGGRAGWRVGGRRCRPRGRCGGGSRTRDGEHDADARGTTRITGARI